MAERTGVDQKFVGDAVESLPDSVTPKRLILFCDGTWNDLRCETLTNVARLAKSVRPTGRMEVAASDREVPQVVYYDEGVGIGEGVSAITDTLVKALGGALGRGLDAKIERAYRFIVLNYTPGDQIFIFGFSRGAYTARSLCGLIRNAGIVRRTEFEQVPKAIQLYRTSAKPSSEEAQAFRRDYSYDIIAGEEDYTDDDRALIKIFRKKVNVADQVKVIPPELRRRGIHIRYLGVWDTVGALGVPSRFHLLKWLTKHRYRFHDDKASALVESLRHAVALDEERADFDATLFGNIRELNLLWSAADVEKQVHSPSGADYSPYSERPYQQKWFPGDHASVGGGWPERGLSSAALLWIAEGAELAGLNLDRSAGSELHEAGELCEPGANWPKLDGKPDLIRTVGGVVRRKGPATQEEVHVSALERKRRFLNYRPPGLVRFEQSDIR